MGQADCDAMALMGGSSQEEKFSTYLLDVFLALFVEWWCIGCCGSVLFPCTIFDGFGWKRRMLGFRWACVLELFECLLDITWH